MDATAVPESELRFESPPVQQVILGVYFRPVMRLGTLHFMTVLNEWRDKYPQIDEQPHAHLWRPLTDAERQEGGPRGPLTPLYELQSEDGQRAVSVQRDRLVLTWRFEAVDSPKQYAGYASLREELRQRMSELQRSLKESAGVDVHPERTDVTYQNLVDMDARDFCVGVLTSWSGRSASFDRPSAYSGMRFGGFHDDPEEIETLVAIEDGPDGEGTDFTIDVERQVGEGEEYLAAIDEAHRVAINLFERLSSPELLASWGRQ